VSVAGPWGSNDFARSIIQSRDHGYVVTGDVEDLVAGPELFVFKLDSIGGLEWAEAVGDSLASGAGYSVIETYDKGYAVAGNTDHYGAGSWDFYIVRLDSVGNLKWTRTIGMNGEDEAYSLIQTEDRGLLVAGGSDSAGPNPSNIYLVKLDSIGSLEWTKAYGDTGGNWAMSVIETKDKGYAVAGVSSYMTSWNENIHFSKLDSSGNICVPTVSKGILDSGGFATKRGYVTSFDSGRIGSGGILTNSTLGTIVLCKSTAVPKINAPSLNINVFPNPNRGVFSIDFSAELSKAEIIIYDIFGREIYSETLNQVEGNDRIDISSQSSGVYLYRVISENGEQLGEGKVIIQR
jgi:hypothetical protein